MAFKYSKVLLDLLNQNFLKSTDNIDNEILEPGSYAFPGSGSYLGGSGILSSFNYTFPAMTNASGVLASFDSAFTWKFNEPLTIKPFESAEVIKSQPTQEADDGVKRRIKRGGYTSA